MARADHIPTGGNGGARLNAVRGAAGFFQAGQDQSGRWWLNDPDGRPFFLRAVHGVKAAGALTESGLPLDAAARLRRWGFNALGVSQDGAVRDDGLPFLAAAEFIRVGKTISAASVRLPDVFDPEWPLKAMQHAQDVCGVSATRRELIGWVTDSHLAWGGATAGRPSLLQICLSLEPGFAAYHAAWEFVLALHGGKLDTLAGAWGTALPNKETVRELTRAETGLVTRGYLRDEARWTREFARRYFAATAAAVRAADPHHLVLGARCRDRAGAPVMAEAVYPAIDVALAPWSELPLPSERVSHPVIASDVSWSDEAWMRPPPEGRPRRLTTFERMLRRARTMLDRTARQADVVGYVWSRWEDEPGEQPPFARGLVHVNGVEAREHTEVLTQFNLRAEALHREGGA